MGGSAPDARLVESLRQSLQVIEKLEGELARTREDVAVVGMACRFPGARDLDEFWVLLRDGVDAITEVPADRWDVDAFYHPDPAWPGTMYSRYGGFVDGAAEFDPLFFGISPKEAARIDPQHRLLLEVAWEAVEHACQAPAALRRSRTGVFVGIAENDYARVVDEAVGAAGIDHYDATGTGFCFASGRISHALGLQGPNLAIDTACSSSLVAVHQAMLSLRAGECDLALAGGVQLRLAPTTSLSLAKARALAPDGRCKTFSAAADGFGRSEGCGLVVLKRLSDAVRDGDIVLAVLRGSAVNHDGPASGFTVPNEQAQVQLVRAALKQARVAPSQIGYLEAHGTGTALGDPIEVSALGAVFGGCTGPIALGSVKTNIGHAEGAAGIAALIKTVLAIRLGVIPPNLHFGQPNPLIPWDALPFGVPVRAEPWPDGRPYAGVSSFGMSGTNAHIVLAPAPPVPERAKLADRGSHVLALSAKTEVALAELAGRYTARLAGDRGPGLADICYTANVHRSHFAHRLAVVADSVPQARALLADAAAGRCAGARDDDQRGQVAFLFPAHGSRYQGMARELLETQPTFLAAIERCASAAAPLLPEPLLSVIDSDRPDGDELPPPVLFAVEYALAQLWLSWGVSPDLVLGEGVGALAAACAAGVFSPEDGLALTVCRGAAHAEFAEAAAAVSFAPPRIGVVSDVTGELAAPQTLCDPAYWAAQIERPARLAAGIRTLRAAGADAFVELGPGSELLALGQSALPDDRACWLPSMGQGARSRRILTSLAQLYMRGAAVDWAAVGAGQGSGRRKTHLPAYPFQRDRYWVQPRPGVPAATSGLLKSLPVSSQATGTRTPTFDVMIRAPLLGAIVLEKALSCVTVPVLAEHKIGEAVVVPAAGHLVMVIDAALAALTAGGPYLHIEDVVFASPLLVPAGGSVTAQLVLTPVADLPDVTEFRLITIAPGNQAPVTHATGRVSWPPPEAGLASSMAGTTTIADLRARLTGELSGTGLYARLAGQGIVLGPSFRWIRRLWTGDGEVLAELEHPAGSEIGSAAWPESSVHPGLLDACFQATEALAADETAARLPFGVRSLTVVTGTTEPARYVSARRTAQGRFDVDLLDRDGRPLTRFSGFEDRPARPESVGSPRWHDWLAQVRWSPDGQAAAGRSGTGRLLVVSHGGALGRDVLAAMADVPGEFVAFDEGSLRADDACQQAISAALAGGPLDGVVFIADRDTELTGHGSADAALPGAWAGLGAAGLAGAGLVEVGSGEPGSADAGLGQPGSADAGLDRIGLGGPGRARAGLADVPDAVQALCGSLLKLTLTLSTLARPPRLSVVTRTAQQVLPGDRVDPVQSALSGLVRTVTAEYPALRSRCIDVGGPADPAALGSLPGELTGDHHGDRVALRGTERYLPRLAAIAPPRQRQPVRLSLAEYGSPDQLALTALRRSAPGPREVEIEVRAAGLNFRDVLTSLGMLTAHSGVADSDDPRDLRLGLECSGAVSAVGQEVAEFRVGDPVIAMTDGGFASFAVADAGNVAALPAGLDYVAGASIPLAFLTASHALNGLAGLNRGERVLIHAAAGGVGMAAVQLALAAGAQVFATASRGKWHALHALGIRQVYDSRSTQYADQIIEHTAGQGVQVVLNSLTGEHIPSSLRVLGPGGRFVEIGKLGIWTAAQVRAERPDVRYFPFDLGQEAAANPALVPALFRELGPQFAAGTLVPPPLTTFPADQARRAYRLMQRAGHVGKVVLTFGSVGVGVPGGGCYLVTGGLGGLGLVVAGALVEAGAGAVVLFGRGGVLSGGAGEVVAGLRGRGVVVRVVAGDVGSAGDVGRVLGVCAGLGGLRGVVHAAGVVDDGVLAGQSGVRFGGVLAAKVRGGWWLDRLTRGVPLDFFVAFSSVASLFDEGGQGAYPAANAFLDGLMARRRAEGLPGLAINWGPWSEVGMAAGLADRFASRGVSMIAPEDGAAAFLGLLRAGAAAGAQVVVAPPGRDPAHAARPPAGGGALAGGALAGGGASVADQVMQAPAAERLRVLRRYVTSQVAALLELQPGQHPGPRTAFAEIGMDSLMVVELRNRLQADLAVALPAMVAFDHPTVERLSEYVAEQLGLAAAPDTGTGDGDQLAPQTLRRMLDEELSALMRPEEDGR